jgi:hypothetical protein
MNIAITLFIILALVTTWPDTTARRLLLIALISYIAMRVWSALFFIPEMLASQKVSPDSVVSRFVWKLMARPSRLP